MNLQVVTKNGWGGGAVLLALIITAGLGSCLVDAHDGGHAMTKDLSAGILAVILHGIVIAGLLLVGRAPSRLVQMPVAVPVGALDPPPKPFAR